MPKRYLTKSRFKLAMECPTKLYYAQNSEIYKNAKTENDFLETLAEGGFQVGQMATLTFPDGIEIDAKENEAAIIQTRKYLEGTGRVVLFEPAFAFEDLLVRVDIFVKDGPYIEIIEVKAKSHDSKSPAFLEARASIRPDMVTYIRDIAFQKYVMSRIFPKASIKAFFIMPDKSVQATTDGLNQCFRIKSEKGQKLIAHTKESKHQVIANSSILKKVQVDPFIDTMMNNPLNYPGSDAQTDNCLPNVSKIWAEAYKNNIKIPPTMHSGCGKCEFRADKHEVYQSGFHQCLEQFTNLSRDEIDQGTVLDIWRFRKKDELINSGIFKISDAANHIAVKPTDGGLSTTERQMLQVAGIPTEKDKGGFYFDCQYFRKAQRRWKYPYHFIDFETCTVALPFFRGMRPYEPIAFQFSHHVMHKDGSVEHRKQCLITEVGKFPNFDFVRELKKSLQSDSGTIFRWAAHENTILNQIRDQLINYAQSNDDTQTLINFIDSITNKARRSMIDLNALAIRCYFHPDTKGKTSIKQVLPAVLKSSKVLKEEYSKPMVHTTTSLNFPDNFIWYQQTNGSLINPYNLLNTKTADNSQDKQTLKTNENLSIADGGAAATAYARLQFESLSLQDRQNIEKALLRYCELDTLAMVMIFKAWLDWC